MVNYILIIIYPGLQQKFKMYHKDTGMYAMIVEQFDNGFYHHPTESFIIDLAEKYEEAVDEMFQQIKLVMIQT